MKILSFELDMANVGSWNGKWSGSAKKYYKTRRFDNETAEKILNSKETKSYYYNFGDGWGAKVYVEVVDSKEASKRRKVSAGFCGYDWMIDSIIKNNDILNSNGKIK